MAERTGSADLPLHGGKVPEWLASRMARLGRVIVEALVLKYGRHEVLRRLSSPFWFQCFGAVMGMDWHSSGITTSVLGALKRGLAPVARELGVHVCGGRGRHSRRTPDELRALGDRAGVDAEALVRASRLVAKVDSAAVQDGFDIYLHGFIACDDGAWAVVQQGMSPARRQARRYHWIWERAGDFVDEPHAAIAGEPRGLLLNLTDHRAAEARAADVELATQRPDNVVGELARLAQTVGARPHAASSSFPTAEPLPHLSMPAHHDVRAQDLDLRRLSAALRVAAERGPRDFPELLLTPGIGARTIFALSLVAEVIYGAPTRFSDPARFAFAHGGKDGHPFPVPLHIYDETLSIMKNAVERARLGNDDKLAALQRLDEQVRLVESRAAMAVDAADPAPPIAAEAVGFARGDRAETAKPAPPRPASARPRVAAQLALPFGRRGSTP